ncbi:Bug family tripartite tricarboxylate transporter substrate binding protein [Variovorax saccharolyticus]|uniref:Bug family tripartite tricarboxylate transporter substrate binding protein n=1 Tax=Variovorax saccharolyticus TaxID=3053516 RepID=UPI0025763A82|nr:tripartite tricarboxylate transporter substrate binding protein [Variovorax sp. J31P216]MDM0026428.1 tripartite tricarboxylate transporter substrate binding protein [Variovorax sp. J31P216]
MKFFKLLAAAVLGVLPLLATAQAFPSRTVKIVVPYAAGGGVDVMARVLAERLQRKWGQPVIVENKTGASTIIGASAVAKAAPDGHTLLLTSESTITSNPFLFDKLPYDPVRDLLPVTQLVSLPQMVIAHPSVAARNLDELVALAKAKPNELSYASYGSGSLPHLLFEALKARSGVQLTAVPYKGITPAVTAVMTGEVQLTLAGVSSAQAYLRAGKLKALAVARSQRLPDQPQVPTLREAGFADIDPHESWFGLFVTGGTPVDVVQTLYRDVAEVAADPAFRGQHVLARGFDPVFSTPEAFGQFIQADRTRKAHLIRISGAKAE